MVKLDANRIGPKLWQGSYPYPGPSVARAGVDVLVLCAQELQPPDSSFPGVRIIRAPMDDGAIVPIDRALNTAQLVARELRRGRRVLVTCAMGRNRSGLVSALTLWLLTGMSGAACVARVQGMRADALTNKDFAAFLRKLPARPKAATMEARA